MRIRLKWLSPILCVIMIFLSVIRSFASSFDVTISDDLKPAVSSIVKQTDENEKDTSSIERRETISSISDGKGTITITGKPVKNLDKYGFVLYEDLMSGFGGQKIEVWLEKEKDWKTELSLPYGKYYILVDDKILLSEEVEVPEDCRCVLRVPDTIFYKAFEISEEQPTSGTEEPIELYLLLNDTGSQGTEITDIQELGTYKETEVERHNSYEFISGLFGEKEEKSEEGKEEKEGSVFATLLGVVVIMAIIILIGSIFLGGSSESGTEI